MCERAWVIDSRSLAKKVRNASRCGAHQSKDYGAKLECPNCHYLIDNTDVSPEWAGLPVGVKFDPSDAELLEHLAEKCGVGSSKSHLFIDEFIVTLDSHQGICYTHPQNLPGIKTDGSSVHFFHKTSNAYATGQRKRRKINNQHCFSENVRWHKTGKTKAVIENGVHKGCKKIMVLYKSSKKGSKPDKANWVMHQYHLGAEEDEKEGEYVVSKIFYQQQKQSERNDMSIGIEDSDIMQHQAMPRTPNSNPPLPPRPVKCDDTSEDNVLHSLIQEADHTQTMCHSAQSSIHLEDNTEYPAWLAGESQVVDNCEFNCVGDKLLSEEILGSFALASNTELNRTTSYSHGRVIGNINVSCGIADLENLELGTPPDFQLTDLQFGSQDSILGWLDKFSSGCD